MQNLDTNTLSKNNEEVIWSNAGNSAFYEAVQVEGLQGLAEKGGLATGCDMRVLTPYWSKAQSILDVGAGYGRAIDYLLKHQFQGTITAIERCNFFFEHLKKQYAQYKNIHLLHTDIRYLDAISDRFDLILFLWTGIGDFSLAEQSTIIKNLANLLQDQGVLIIDTLPENTIPLGSKKCGKNVYSFESDNFIAYIHVSTLSEIEDHAKEAGFSNIAQINYQTDSNRQRSIYVLS